MNGWIIAAIVIAAAALFAAVSMVLLKKFRPKKFELVKTRIRKLFSGILYYSLIWFPRSKKIMLFGGEQGKSFDGNTKYLFLEAAKVPGLRPVWICKSGKLAKKIRAMGYEAYTSRSSKGIWLQLRAKTIVLSSSLKEDFFFIPLYGATSVNLWHGVGLKRSWFRNMNSISAQVMASKPSLSRSIKMWWIKTNQTRRCYVVGTSERVCEYYPATYNIKPENVLNLGQARNDVFYDDSLEQTEIPEYFRTNKIILYMPTHRFTGVKSKNLHDKTRDDMGSRIDYKRLSPLLQKYGYTFVIKQHRWTKKTIKTKYPNIIDITHDNFNFDPQLLLKYTDILITDYSSCYTDFLLLDRPVIFYCYDMKEYLSKWEFNFDYDEVTPGPKAMTSNELIDAIESFMKGEDDYREERARVLDIFYSPENRGLTAKKQLDYILGKITKYRV